MLNTYSDLLFADQATVAKVQEAIASSIIFIGAQGQDRFGYTRRNVFCVNLAIHTVTKIGKCPDDLAWPHACCITDSGIFYGDDEQCNKFISVWIA